MPSYQDLVEHFGKPLFDAGFQAFLQSNFDDLIPHPAFFEEENEFLSEKAGLEIGSTNENLLIGEDGSVVEEPVFTDFNLLPNTTIHSLPFGALITDGREELARKAGPCLQKHRTNDPFDWYEPHTYIHNEVVITFHYRANEKNISNIRIVDMKRAPDIDLYLSELGVDIKALG